MGNKRNENEKKFENWIELENGGRIYSYEIIGKTSGKALYIKEVDKDEKTVRFHQEVYDNSGKLIEIHEKYPEDTGHRKVD